MASLGKLPKSSFSFGSNELFDVLEKAFKNFWVISENVETSGLASTSVKIKITETTCAFQ